MLTLLLTATDGGTTWRHLLAPGAARAGWECVGPRGLAQRLGRVVGFPCTPAPTLERLAVYMDRLDRLDDGRRSYSASRRADPYGVATHLLSLREQLLAAGWLGAKLDGSARLADLSALESVTGPALAPGQAELIRALTEEVARVGTLPVPLTVRLAAPREGFSPVVLALLEALARTGATIVAPEADAPRAPADTDLGKLQRALLTPGSIPPALTGDGTLLLLEADTALEASELTAGALRATDLATTTVVAAAETAALDVALRRQGLPTLGLASTSPFRPHLQALPLRLALAFRPRDPFRAAELLMLPGAPLPAQARRKLLGALNAMPGIGSPDWQGAVDAAVEEAVRRAREDGASERDAAKAGKSLAERIADWFAGEDFDPHQGIPAATAAAICATVAGWAGARSGAADEDGNALDAGLWAQAASVARRLEQVLRGHPPDQRISQLALAQLHDLAVGGGSDGSPFEGEAGRPAVTADPGAVLPGAETVCWFGFVKDAGPSVSPDPWTETERAALAAAGLTLSAPGARRSFEAWGWCRPVLEARSRALLVRWRLSGTAPVPAHALLDELRTRVATGSIAACTLGSERLLGPGVATLSPPLITLDPATPVRPRPVWRVPKETLQPNGHLSSSSIEALLGCPFRWALQYQAQLKPGQSVDLPDGSRLLGSFAHRLLQDLLVGDERIDLAKATPADASTWIEKAFDARVAAEAAPLVRQGREVERESARTLVSGAAAAVVKHLQAGHWKPTEAELEVEGQFAGHPVRGYVDLRVEKDGKPAVLDFKLSGGKYRREELADGHALQLALYSAMLKTGGSALPPAAFLTLDDGQLLTVYPQAFPGAMVVEGPSPQETLDAAATMLRAWEKVFAEGLLPVCSAELPWEEEVVAATGPLPDPDSLARREPSCLFCTFQTLCRAAVGEEVAA